MSRTETLLLQVVERGSLAGLTPVKEVVVERREHEPDFMLEDRVKRAYLIEVEQKAKHMPVMRQKLVGRDWCIDCTLV
ncbi:hypothetical protein [Pseudomonas aeruginosa]|uniref:hypothetical protein n=1 Tax=Pseudomonas aeruginosa TaxID=287 RepID=UPI0005B42DA6|nr:hypothetical protein [Pseudomonas aeruginosa]